MTGPEHYREAEKWLATAQNWFEMGNEYDPASAAVASAAAAIAQGHAILADAAANALQIRGADTVAWEATAGPRARGDG
ncbi:hypothetical protein Prum_052090 [Phytohabitans rumicis]|uniref:Uncharacterized protein n=1 Tax=Phytohabitans rumicis TaxID=1076125 RepID=A0A6V8LBY7_9ACTN|nr:hypothetical protein Prum_052090 [Phytohabitans rumicis]